LFDKVDAVVNMFDDIILIFVVRIDLQMIWNVINMVIDLFVDGKILVYADAVISARMPYYLRIAAFCAPKMLPRYSPPNYWVSGSMQLMFSTMGF
jgi:hypothetical protein